MSLIMSARDAATAAPAAAAASEDKHLVRMPLECLRRPLMCKRICRQIGAETGRAAGNGSYFTMGADKSHTPRDTEREREHTVRVGQHYNIEAIS